MTMMGTGTINERDIRDEFGYLSTSTLAPYMLSSSTFASGAGTVTAPTNSNLVYVLLIGGGGGGARWTGGVAGGGGGGAFVSKLATITGGTTISYTVGGGGTGATVNNTAGTSGSATTTTGATSLILRANGGSGGNPGTGGYGGFPVGGDGRSSPGGTGNDWTTGWGGDAGGYNYPNLPGRGGVANGANGGNYGGGGAGGNAVNGGNGGSGVAKFYFYNFPSVLLRDYLTAGGRVAPHHNNQGIPSSGTLKIGDFRTSGNLKKSYNFHSSSDWSAGIFSNPLGTPTSPLGTEYFTGYDIITNIGTKGTINYVGTSTFSTTTASIMQLYNYRYDFSSVYISTFAISGRCEHPWFNAVVTAVSPGTPNTVAYRTMADAPNGAWDSLNQITVWNWSYGQKFQLTAGNNFTATVYLASYQ